LTIPAAHQADYYDHKVLDPEFEINRPHGESRFYDFLMNFKFMRVTQLLRSSLAGKKVLVICCGSGMDAEYLSQSGASVIALDISAGCLDRARKRANRYSLRYELIRGDAEALPFRDGAFDYGFVHDGLHHLNNPDTAVTELARVSLRGILITEPARAGITRLLVHLRMAQDYEDAGNFVARLDAKHHPEH